MECKLVKEYHNNECAIIREYDNIEIQKKCFGLAEQLAQISDNKEFLFGLADHYVNGIGVTKDLEKGLRLYEEIANLQLPISVTAQSQLGIYYVAEDSSVRDLNKAEYWLKKAPINNDPVAQCDYAMLLKIQNKHKESWHWYKKAAANDSPRAKYKLANLVIKGYKIGITRKEAYKLLLSAVDQGYTPAFYSLAIMYKEDGNKKNADYWACKFMNTELYKNLRLGLDPEEAWNKAKFSEKKEKYLAEVRKEKEENAQINKNCQ